MWSPGPMELGIILVIVVMLFGAGKLPKVAKEVGEGMRSLRGALKDDEVKPDEKT